jgi:hypothetical protein
MTFQDQGTQQPPQEVVDTGNGILVGVQPAQPRQASDWTGQQPQQQQGNGQQPPQQQVFTAEQVEAFRQQEKDKLYPELQNMSAQLRALQEERDQEKAERQRLADEAEQARLAKEESELDLRTLMEKRDAEFREQLEERDRRYEADRAVFEQERRLGEIQEYRRQRIEQEQEYLLPEIRDFVAGSTPEEIDQSIEYIKERSQIIASNFAAAAQQQQQPFRGGAMPSVPPVGPMEQLPSYEQMSPDVIAAMDMDTYKRYRPQLLQATNPNRNRRGQ